MYPRTSDLVTVPSMSDTTILAVLLRRKILALLVTTVPVLVSTLYSRLFTPDLRPSCSSCACVAELVLSLGSGARPWREVASTRTVQHHADRHSEAVDLETNHV